MEKLELKHLAPYLPYGLKFKNLHGDIVELTGLSNGNSAVINILTGFKQDGHYTWGYIEQCKPILRPMTDLINQVLDDRKIPIIELSKIGCMEYFQGLINLDIDRVTLKTIENDDLSLQIKSLRLGSTVDFRYIISDSCFSITAYGGGSIAEGVVLHQLQLFEKLFEWHFDVFGLIEKGLAIDINTLKQS